jgi:cell division protein FtsB
MTGFGRLQGVRRYSFRFNVSGLMLELKKPVITLFATDQTAGYTCQDANFCDNIIFAAKLIDMTAQCHTFMTKGHTFGENVELKRQNVELKRQNGALKRHNGELKRHNGELMRHNCKLKSENGALKRHNVALKRHNVALKSERFFIIIII